MSNFDTSRYFLSLIKDVSINLSEVKFLSYFWGPMPIMIWLATVVEMVTSIFQSSEHWLDVGVLLLLQFVNGSVGWFGLVV